ncbi:efflux RND transporter permease subunit [Paludibacterium denitrificans]|uniref:efflux RND transporter permease subunit n=1 Tax=Paludibacterium denitrificans TaxID=2675226 RepID=UPI00247811AE|nr:efflux RND transporter permease subunit [Paludibacterium denitrificans]
MKKLNLSEWALHHQALVMYLMVVLMLAGMLAYSRLGQKEDPEFTFKAMIVQVKWPGATANEVEQQVTDKLEKKLMEMGELDYVQSYTKPGEALMVLSIREEVPPKNVPQLWYQVRKKMGDIRSQLPSDIQGPYFNDEFGDTFGNIYAFTGDGFNDEELRRYVEDAKREVLRVPDVGKVDIIGEQEERIYVDLSSAKLASLGLDSASIWAALQQQNAMTPV